MSSTATWEWVPLEGSTGYIKNADTNMVLTCSESDSNTCRIRNLPSKDGSIQGNLTNAHNLAMDLGVVNDITDAATENVLETMDTNNTGGIKSGLTFFKITM